MAIERTFAMLKPGVLQRRIAGEIIARIEKKGLKIVGLKLMQISPELAGTHYGEHKEKPFYGELVSYITSGPVVAMAIEGDDAVSLVRRMCGATKVSESLPGTIRGDYSMHTGTNIIHSSDSPESAARELGLFFKKEEFVVWEDGNTQWF
jgi:nucleoside-diphosphate kinase